MEISSRDNPKVKLYRKLASSKKAREEMGLFVIEGMRSCVDAVEEYLRGNIKLHSVFYVPEAKEKYADHLATCLFDDLKRDMVYEITREVSDKMSDEGSSQGAFVIAQKLDKEFSQAEIVSGGKYLVLDNLQDPGNLGTLLRTADAVGVDGVVLTNNCVDLYNPKAVRSAMGSMPRINIYIENDFYKVVDVFGSAGVKTAAAVTISGTVITDYDFSQPVAVVIGNEGRGLSQEHADSCTDKVTISMRGNIDSLNAATAGTIFLWEMTRERAANNGR